MGKRKLLEENLLKKAAGVLQDAGFSARYENAVYIDLNNVGDRADNQFVQISFLPATEEQIELTGFNTLQLICFISEELSVDTCNELARAILKINPKIVSGAFNIDEQNASFFYKSTAVFTDNMDEEISFALIQVYIGLFLSNLDMYNDVLMDIIEGTRTADDAIKKGII